jgi:hypothetical protein
METFVFNHQLFVVDRALDLKQIQPNKRICFEFFLPIVVILLIANFSTDAQSRRASRKFQYETIGLEDVIRRYMVKDGREVYPLEGMYSVTCTVVKRYKSWPWKVDKEKIVLMKENYARVAILKDWPDATREFIEMSLTQKDVPKLPIVGEFNQWKEGEGYIYKHTEPKGGMMSFTFLLDKDGDVLEGVRSEVSGSKTIIYTLTYVKIFPKSPVDTFVNNN